MLSLICNRDPRVSRAPKRASHRGGGFSLLELLLVMAVMGTVAALAIPSSMSMIDGWRLTMAGQNVVEKLNMARQRAISRNRTVEVRIYQYGDTTLGESAASPASGKYRALQIFEINELGNYVPFGKFERLPLSVVIDRNTGLSSLFNVATGVQAGSASYGAIAGLGTSYNFVAFQFTPDGSTNLSPDSLWFLSLHGAHVGDSLATLPANYCTIQIDPFNGHIKSYRP